jgi:ribosomal-protein-alanine N-acetyltransferase
MHGLGHVMSGLDTISGRRANFHYISRQMQIPRIVTQRLVLSVPSEADAQALLDYAIANFDNHSRWSPPPPADWRTFANALWRAREYRERCIDGSAVRLWLRSKDNPNGPFLGAVSLTQIVFAARRACSMGYHLDHRHQGQGYMHEAASAATVFAFDTLQLNRVEATYIPENERSAKVLARLGFEIEGRAKAYLFINGKFQDHVLTGLVNRKLVNAAALCTPT